MKEKKRSAVDVSRELIIDSIVLTKEVLHSIHNNLPVPLEHVSMQRLDSTAELAAYQRPEPSMRMLGLSLFLAMATVLLVAL